MPHKTNLSVQSELNPHLGGTESHPAHEKVQFVFTTVVTTLFSVK